VHAEHAVLAFDDSEHGQVKRTSLSALATTRATEAALVAKAARARIGMATLTASAAITLVIAPHFRRSAKPRVAVFVEEML
jgi:hypothetical protein